MGCDADIPLCPGGPTTEQLIEAWHAVECRPPVVRWSIDWSRAVVVLDLTGDDMPEWPEFALERGLEPELYAIRPPAGFRKLSECLPE